MANYGIPYMGSKDKLIHKLAFLFPAADNFYDLFGGGFSVSHFMILHHSNKYKRMFYNEIESDTVQVIRDAISGKYNYNVFKPQWISREDFLKNKDQCAYTRLTWSFGNNQIGYLFGKKIESDKRSLHQAVVFNEFNETAKKYLNIESFPKELSIRGRRLFCRKIILERKGELQQLERLQQLQQLQQLQRLEQLEQLERLQQLERLERLEQLEFSSKSYDEVPILPNSVIYCDPPYKGTSDYLNAFNHEKFWDWVVRQSEPVFVSEYQAPKGIATLAAFRHKKLLSSVSRKDFVEKLFGNNAAVKKIRETMKQIMAPHDIKTF